jgi:hypothetical protein
MTFRKYYEIFLFLIGEKLTKINLIHMCMFDIPGHFFNIEHSPYLFPMFSFKKHRSMHVCNHVTKVTKINT